MTDDLPPLPEPWDYCYEWDGPYGSRKFSAASHNDRPPDRSVPIYTADQLRAYGDAVREQCAQICDARVIGDHNREDAEAAACAAAIRAPKDQS